MIASVEARTGTKCIVRWTGRDGLRVISTTYCGLHCSAGDGVTQVPEKAIDCGHCKTAVKTEHGVAYDA